MASIVEGKALTILKPKDDNSFEVDEKALEEILLDKRVKNSKVMILSVAGAFRGGKSFLLNFFLRYLRNAGSDGWMGDLNKLCGFDWKSGSERVTSGILLWSEPFFVTLPSGEVCVLLMDTQGSFDSHSTVKECATIFAFSTLISSVQIYNISKNLREDDLQYLEYFTEYGKLALESDAEGHPFQSLHFLVRDWQYPYEYCYGSVGGKELLEERMKIEGKASELQNLRKNLKKCFKDINCFLMPHPGLKITNNPSLNVALSDVEPDFKDILMIYAEFLFAPENIETKTINGKQLSGKELLHYFKSYAEIFQNGVLPEPKKILEATAEANNLAAKVMVLDSYEKKMAEKCCTSHPYLEKEELDIYHKDCYAETLTKFRETKKFGGKVFNLKYEEELKKDILKNLDYFKSINNEKKPRGWFWSLTSYKLPIIASTSFILGGPFLTCMFMLTFAIYKASHFYHTILRTRQRIWKSIISGCIDFAAPILFIIFFFFFYIISGILSWIGIVFLKTFSNITMGLSIFCFIILLFSKCTGYFRWLREKIGCLSKYMLGKSKIL